MVIELHVNGKRSTMVYIEDWAGIYHENMEYPSHDGPPKVQNGLLQPPQRDPAHICNEAMIKFKI